MNMDGWQSMFRNEEEELDFFLREEFGDMEQSVIRQFQDEAEQAYIRLPQPEAAQCAQVVMLAEIALQLAKLNASLDAIGNLLLHQEKRDGKL
jgi:hypothetical protein